MGNQNTMKAIATAPGTAAKNQTPLRIELVNADGSPQPILEPAATQADSVATTVPALVTDFNALLAKLRAAGYVAPNA